MTLNELTNIILNAEPGNEAEEIHITQRQYDSLKRDMQLHFTINFNYFHGPKGPVWIRIKNESKEINL